MHKKWNTKLVDALTVERLAQALALHRLTATVLAARGIETAGEAGMFLAPSLSDMLDPQLLLGMEGAVGRLLAARRNRETICVYGDYDVDGITGTALLVSFLRQTGFSCRYFIPNRFDDGYGLGRESIQGIIDLGAELIVSVDCGITAVDEALFCAGKGIDLIVVDHHLPKDTLPAAVAVINPVQPGCPYPFKSLAGVGVATQVKKLIFAGFPNVGDVMIHINPHDEKHEVDPHAWLHKSCIPLSQVDFRAEPTLFEGADYCSSGACFV